MSSYIFSFQNFVSNINDDQFLTDPSSIVCNCVNSPYIVTGDLRIIKDKKLQKPLSESPEPRKIDFDQGREKIIHGIEDSISLCSQKDPMPDAVLLAWKNK